MWNLLDDAIDTGRIPESRRSFWANQLVRKPRETTRKLKELRADMYVNASGTTAMSAASKPKPLKIGEVRSDADSMNRGMADDIKPADRRTDVDTSRARSDGFGRALVPHPAGGYVTASSAGGTAGSATDDDEGLPQRWFPETGRV
jgi:hypothetical protein